MNRKLIFPVLALMLAILACNIPVSAETPPVIITDTPSTPQVTAIETPSSPPLPVVSSPGIVTIQMFDVNIGWAISDTNVLRTTDGGVTWLNTTPAGVSSVGWAASCFFLNNNTAWISLPNTDTTTGTLYKSLNGGATWVAVPVPFASGGLQFLDEINGWAITSLGAGAGSMGVAIFRTNDSGSTWTQVFVNDPTVPGSSESIPLSGMKTGFAFLDANHGWVGGMEPVNDFIYLYASSDGGGTWALQDVNLPSGYAGIQTAVISPHFFSAAEGILPVGLLADPEAIVLYLTHDGGLTWSPSTPVTISGQVSIASLTEFFAWDGGPILNVSHDSGSTWESVSPNVNIHDTFITFQFVNATTGWALTGDASKHYTLYKTSDGGSTWNILIP